jgi:ribosomal protein S18 acetylase RimI-like enzyme
MHQDHELAGYMKLNSGAAQTVEGKAGTLEIERIYVLAKFHGKQMGKRLLQHAIDVAKEAAYDTIWLGVWERNTKAIAFYERNGFSHTGADVNPVSGRPVLKMQWNGSGL